MDVITLGETMILLHPENMQQSLITANNFSKTIAGAESNVSIALSRLGHNVGWIGKLGDDAFGIYIRNFIRGEGVDTDRVVFDRDYSTGLMIKDKRSNSDPNIIYYRSNSAGSHLSPSQIDESYFRGAKFLHLTGITPALSESSKKTIYKAIEIAKKNDIKVVFDPNIRYKLWGKNEAYNVLLDISSKADIILPGIEEGEFLTGFTSPEDISNFFLQNSETVVVKLGEKGAFYRTSNDSGYVQGLKVHHIVDTVGAGDGFAAGFISGMLKGMDVPQATVLANEIGAHALTTPGDVEGYPYESDLNKSGEAVLR